MPESLKIFSPELPAFRMVLPSSKPPPRCRVVDTAAITSGRVVADSAVAYGSTQLLLARPAAVVDTATVAG